MDHSTPSASPSVAQQQSRFAETSVKNEAHSSGVSWAAVIAGAFVAAALSLILLALGTGLGLSSVSPWSNAGASASTVGKAAIVWLIVMQIIASAMGGYLAGRLRTKWANIHTDEVYFRDTAHGFVAWALATVLGAVLLATPASNLLGGTAAGVMQGAVSSTSRAGPMDGYVDTLLRSDAPAAQSTGQNSGNASDSRGEMVRLFTSSFRNGGDLKPADREYVSKVVAARTGLSQADADKRVNDVVTQIKVDTDAARKAAAQLAFWLTASLLIGAFCASLAATEGGGLRDGTWRRRAIR